MSVDVQTEIEIARRRAEVGSLACDPDKTVRWYELLLVAPAPTASAIGFFESLHSIGD